MEKAILLGVGSDADVVSQSLSELQSLAETAGCEAVCVVSQKRETPHRVLYAGKGKIEEIKTLVDETDATVLITDDELSGSQIKNLSNALDIKVIDRTVLILDIFASRAMSAEGKLQVELAQQKYRLSRLTGLGTSLSRLGGGIGTRGPGEKKLETDRRHIRRAVTNLENELKEIQKHRAVIRKSREKSGVPTVSLVGYTNAGKSTVMNALTKAGVMAENKLFATLDTTTRALDLPNGFEIRLSDTVGFINKLPHQLVKAFRATLEELYHADLLLHIIDISREDFKEQTRVVEEVLQKIGCLDKPIINVYNKIDLTDDFPKAASKAGEAYISAQNGINLDMLLAEIENELKAGKKRVRIELPYTESRLLPLIHSKCEIVSETHEENGTVFDVFADEEILNRFASYLKPAD